MTKSAGRFQATGLVLSLVLISGLSSVVGYWAGTRSVTPLEAALSAQPPDAEPVLVPVERGQLVDRFTLPGTVLPWSDVTPIVFSVDAPHPIVTASFIQSGEVPLNAMPMIEIAARPVFALSGATPAYRDLARGDRGDDVAAIQEALTAAELYDGPVDGILGWRTASALALMYTRADYAPPAASQRSASAPTALAGDVRIAESSPSVVLPFSEYAIVPTNMVLIDPIPGVGQQMDAGVITLSSDEVRIVEVPLTTVSVPLFAQAIRIEVTTDDGRLHLARSVGVASAEGGGDLTGRMSVDGLTTDVTAVQVIVTARVSAVDSLLVPTAALVVDGSSFAVETIENGQSILVRVEVGLTFGGKAELTDAGSLEEGSLIVVPVDS